MLSRKIFFKTCQQLTHSHALKRTKSKTFAPCFLVVIMAAQYGKKYIYIILQILWYYSHYNRLIMSLSDNRGWDNGIWFSRSWVNKLYYANITNIRSSYINLIHTLLGLGLVHSSMHLCKQFLFQMPVRGFSLLGSNTSAMSWTLYAHLNIHTL